MLRLQSLFCLCLLPIFAFAQVNYTANDKVPTYDEEFGYGTNMGYNPPYSDQQIAEIASGKSANGIHGAGVNALRPGLWEYFLEAWGYDIRTDAFDYYGELGMKNNVAIVGYPSDEHRDKTEHCATNDSKVFDNLWEPIWDNGENGTPINEDNYLASYLYKLMPLYGDNIKFYEIWNEPDFDYGGNAWKPRGVEGNWYENDPDPCSYALGAPVWYYVRMLRVSYEVIKHHNPDALVCTGGVGFPSFMDAVLRHSDNPDGGKISEEYPLGGGAFFDVLSFHSYPHLEGIRTWDLETNAFHYERHSDKAAQLYVQKKRDFENLLSDYGYNDETYPEKLYITTECNIPRKKFKDHIGSEEASKNFNMKALILSHKEDIKQYYIYNIAEDGIVNDYSPEFNYMGLYEPIMDKELYTHKYTNSGISFKTTAEVLKGYTYNDKMTREVLTSAEYTEGAVYENEEGHIMIAAWAETRVDESEDASSIVTLSNEYFNATTKIMKWDYSMTKEDNIVSNRNVSLSATPIFIKTIPTQAQTPGSMTHHEIFPHEAVPEEFNNLTTYPNPVTDYVTISLDDMSDIDITVFDALGQMIKLPLEQSDVNATIQTSSLVAGIYYVQLKKGDVNYARKIVKSDSN